MKTRALAILLAAGVTTLAGFAAEAAPAIPAPTASAYFDGIDPSPVAPPQPRQKQPAMTAAWQVAKPGHDGTLTIDGTPLSPFSGHADALWTSAPRKVTRPGQVATIAMRWSGLQPMPERDGYASQEISVRFTDSRGRWGAWLPIYSGLITKALSTGTPESMMLPVRYRGAVPMKALLVQVKVEDAFSYVADLNHTVRIRA